MAATAPVVNDTPSGDGVEADSSASSTVPRELTQYDCVGTDADLEQELAALSVYDNALKEAAAAAAGHGDVIDDASNAQAANDYATGQMLQQMMSASKAAEAAVAVTMSIEPPMAALGNGHLNITPMLPTSQSTINATKQAKASARRERKRQMAQQQQQKPTGEAVGSPATDGKVKEEEEQEQQQQQQQQQKFVASHGYGSAIPPLEFMVEAKSGDVAMSRVPISSHEWTVTFNAMANDLNTRFFTDPMWIEHARAQFQRLQELDVQVRRAEATPSGIQGYGFGEDPRLRKLQAEKAEAMVQCQNSYYEYLVKQHCELLRTQYRLIKADVVLGTTCKQLKPFEIMPIGCGELHAAMLCNTKNAPKRFHLLYALLTCANIVPYSQVEKSEGILNAPERARNACWPRYQLASGFKLGSSETSSDVVVQHVSIYKQLVVVCYCPVGQLDLHVGIHSLGAASQPTTTVRLTGIMSTSSWRVACNGRFLVVAYNDGKAYDKQGRLLSSAETLGSTDHKTANVDYPPNTLQVWSLGANAPQQCFTLSLDAVEDDQATPAADGRSAVITAMCFDVNFGRENYLCVTTRDLRAMTFSLPSRGPEGCLAAGGKLHDYKVHAFELISQTTQQCFVAPTKERELEIVEADPSRRPKNSMREPAEFIQTYYGFETRMAVISRNNFMLKTLCGFGRPPTITEHLNSYNNLMLGTLPVIYQHGANDMQSIACAGNLFVGHFVGENDIVVANMRDKAQLAYIKGSLLLGYSPPEKIGSDDAAHAHGSAAAAAAATKATTNDDSLAEKAKAVEQAERERQEQLARADPYRPWYYYQSTWSTLSRVVVQMVDGTLIILEPVTSTAKHATMQSARQAAGAMFAASASTPAAAAAAAAVATSTVNAQTTAPMEEQ